MAGMFVHPLADWKFKESGIINEGQEIDDLKWTDLIDMKCGNCGDKCNGPLRVTIRNKVTKDCHDLYMCRFCVGVCTM